MKLTYDACIGKSRVTCMGYRLVVIYDDHRPPCSGPFSSFLTSGRCYHTILMVSKGKTLSHSFIARPKAILAQMHASTRWNVLRSDMAGAMQGGTPGTYRPTSLPQRKKIPLVRMLNQRQGLTVSGPATWYSISHRRADRGRL